MPKRNKHHCWALILLISLGIFLVTWSYSSEAAPVKSAAATPTPAAPSLQTLNRDEVANELGWVTSPENHCGGYYVESPFVSAKYLKEPDKVEITSDQYTISQRGPSKLEGKVSISYGSRQILANKASFYRDPNTRKLTTIDLNEALHLREPNTLILAEKGHIDLRNKTNSLTDVLYRTAIYSNLMNTSVSTDIIKQKVPVSALQKPRKVDQLSAWGNAKNYYQNEPKIYNFDQASYTTCPPKQSIWQVKASHLELNKETGRGSARDARILIKGVPIFYTPYMNFPIDNRRKTGLLWPSFGTMNRTNSSSGHYVSIPFYWNMAPNYDTTITPTYFSERGLQLADTFRYLSLSSTGNMQVTVLPDDQYFPIFKDKENQINQSSTSVTTQANLERLNNASNTRASVAWKHSTTFNDNWSGSVDYSYVSDDYYLEDFSKNLTENAQNQLLQQGELNYRNEHWNFRGRVQSYQTLHPVDVDSDFQNQYSRFPQLVLGADYPDQLMGLDFFINNEATHFDFRNTPGSDTKSPMGNRAHSQPGISKPFYWPFLYITPRAQLALTEYEIGHVDNTTAKHQDRAVPIFDVSSGLYLERNVNLFHNTYQQTLEPRLYYVYVPFRNQSQIPVFDTTVNTPSYDLLFTYNRFSGLDRIADANQVSIGVTTRFIDQDSGIERLRAGVGEILYFKNRDVTLCNSPDVCTDYPGSDDNRRHLSPLSGSLAYGMSAYWSASADTIWNPQTRELDNQRVGVQYKLDSERVFNLGYSYVRNGNLFAGIIDNANAGISGNANQNYLQLTDLSFSWPIGHDWGVVGRWSEDWETLHFQNLYYGLQYDSCCWAARFVTGKTFTGVQDNRPQYNSQFFFQITLKGLGSFNPKGDPTAVLRTNISGYESRFGQDL